MNKFFVFTVLLIASKSFSQGFTNRCGTIADMNLIQTNTPNVYQSYLDIEAFTANYITNQTQTNSRLINGAGLIVIPVVIHVLHNGEAEGTGLNISLATIQSQLDVLNEDFRRLNPDAINTPSAFQGVASDFGIEFKLACIDPNGNVTNGVVRKQVSASQYNISVRTDGSYDDDAIGIKKSSTGDAAWPTDHYLNIWVCKMNNGTAGYGTFPFHYSTYPQFDGIVIDKGAFGRNGGTTSGFDKGRTATHEIGHWLNLSHLWGNTISPQFNFDCFSDDLVGDTPQQKTYNSGCPSFPEILRKCNSVDPSSMFMNYMDYTNDQCYNLFTNGQRLRARALFATGGPRATFLNNYFQIQTPTKVSCNGSVIKLFNPTCATPTWSIVSGNATIVSGQNTNSLTVSTPSPGSFVLRATGGNYIEDKTIDVVPFTSSDYTLVGNNGSMYWCPNQTTSFSVSGQGATNYNWSLPTAWTMINNGGSYVVVRAPSSTYPPTGTLSVSVTEPCGTIIAINKFLAYSSSACSPSIPFTLYPSPASTYVNIEVTNSQTNIAAVQITDMYGNILINNQYSGNYTGVQIGVYALQNGPKIAKIYSGTQWYSIQFTVTH